MKSVAIEPVKGRSPDDEVVIRCADVVKRFGSVVALDHLDFEVRRGQVVGYLGPNGAGKSTTIRILMDLARRDSGDVRVLGVDPQTAGPELRRRIGYLPGELRLDDRITVADLLASWARLRGDSVDRVYLADLCDRLDLDTTRDTRALSSGTRRKVGLVGAFMARPEILVLDEPTAGVDPLVQAEFGRLVEEARAAGRTVFLSSHVLSEVQQLADSVVILRRGRVVVQGDIETLHHTTRQPFKVWFGCPVPIDALVSAPGVTVTEASGDVASGTISGSPDGLLQVLANHPVHSLQLPEPDLEDAFRQYYEGADERSEPWH